MTTKIPEVIYLQWYGLDERDMLDAKIDAKIRNQLFPDPIEVTWSADREYDTDVVYRRARKTECDKQMSDAIDDLIEERDKLCDMVDKLRTERDRLRGDLQGIADYNPSPGSGEVFDLRDCVLRARAALQAAQQEEEE